MGHSDPAESSKHSPQHDSAPWGEGPTILTPTPFNQSFQSKFKITLSPIRNFRKLSPIRENSFSFPFSFYKKKKIL
jgi:hypothetical protein